MKDKKKKKSILVRFFQWLEKANKKAVEKGAFCGS
jgi:hypothetical protein